MSMLDRLLGPFWEVAGALMPKRPTIRILSGATAVDNADGEGSTDVTITGDGNATSIGGKVIDTFLELTGWMLALNSSTHRWEAVRGSQVIQTGTVTLDGFAVKVVSIPGLAAADMILWTPSSVDTPTIGPLMNVRTNGAAGEVQVQSASVADTSVWNYCVLRPGAALPA